SVGERHVSSARWRQRWRAWWTRWAGRWCARAGRRKGRQERQRHRRGVRRNAVLTYRGSLDSAPAFRFSNDVPAPKVFLLAGFGFFDLREDDCESILGALERFTVGFPLGHCALGAGA